MKNGRFFAFVLSAAMLFSASACSKEPVEHEEHIEEGMIIVKPAEEPESSESKSEIEHEEQPSEPEEQPLEPEEPEISKPSGFVYPDDLQTQDVEDADKDEYEEEPQDIPVSSAAFPPFDPDELEAPVQRERRRSILNEPVKDDSPAKKKYAPDDYVPISEDDFYNNPWNPEPGKRLDQTPLVVPPKHKGSIPEDDGKDYNYYALQMQL